MLAFHNLCPNAYSGIIRHCDMPTLLKVRATCRVSYDAVRQELHASLRAALGRFVPDVDAFVEALWSNQSFVGGSVAVSFVLRDPDITPANLDVFVPRWSAYAFLCHLLDHQDGTDRTVYPETEEEAEAQRKVSSLKAVWDTYHVSTPLGRINLYVSCGPEALEPIASSWASHLCTYVGADHFGTSCPSLFFSRRAILGSASDAIDPEEDIPKYMRRGFDLRMFPTQWEDLHLSDCGASRGICPTQARYFDDKHALCARFMPLESDHLDPTVAWRMDGRPCGGDCHRDLHDVLARRCRCYVFAQTRRGSACARSSFQLAYEGHRSSTTVVSGIRASTDIERCGGSGWAGQRGGV